MKKITNLILLLITSIILVACSSKSLDGKYYWISSERNELTFTIKRDQGTIEHGEADNFTINKNGTLNLTVAILLIQQSSISTRIASLL